MKINYNVNDINISCSAYAGSTSRPKAYVDYSTPYARFVMHGGMFEQDGFSVVTMSWYTGVVNPGRDNEAPAMSIKMCGIFNHTPVARWYYLEGKDILRMWLVLLSFLSYAETTTTTDELVGSYIKYTIDQYEDCPDEGHWSTVHPLVERIMRDYAYDLFIEAFNEIDRYNSNDWRVTKRSNGVCTSSLFSPTYGVVSVYSKIVIGFVHGNICVRKHYKFTDNFTVDSTVFRYLVADDEDDTVHWGDNDPPTSLYI